MTRQRNDDELVDIPTRIKEHLDQRDDFDLELDVLRSLKERGWVTEHSGAYIDPIESKPRQFDVSAWKEIQPACTVFMSAECKNIGGNFPVVVSSVLRDYDEAYHDVLWSTPEAHSGRGAEPRANRMNVEHQPSLLYPARRDVGKSIAQPDLRDPSKKAPSDENPYSKWSQAIAASASKLREVINHMLRQGRDEYAFLMPVLIVSDNALWVVPYAEDGTRHDPQKVDEATLFVDRPFEYSPLNIKYKITHLHICTRLGFSTFLNKLEQPGMVDRIFDPIRRERLRGG
jgi:hypothetical protein